MGVQVAEVNTKCNPLSFFCTNTKGLHKALWLGLMVPDSNTSFKWFLTSSTISSGICLNHSLKGVLSVTFIICSLEWVQSNSARSNKNTSWYSARSWRAVSASSGVQESRLPKSNSSNNLPCLCLTVRAGVGELWNLPASSSKFYLWGVQAQVMWLPPWPQGSSSEGFADRQ